MSILRSFFVICVGVVSLTPGTAFAEAAEPTVQLHMPDVSMAPHETSEAELTIVVSEPIAAAKIQLHLDVREITRFVDVSVGSGDCEVGGGFVACESEQDLPAGPTILALVNLKAKAAKTGTAGRVHLGAFLNGAGQSIFTAGVEVLVAGEPDLAAIGVTVSTGGANTIRIKVGVKNVGVNPWFSPNRHSVIAYVHVPRNTWGESASYACAGWGPYPDGWGWEDPGRASYQYACRAGLLNPGDTAWFELTLAVDANKPVAPGDITVVEGADSNPANDTGTILVSTASLPVTGTRTWQIGALGGGLLALGALLLLGAHRRKGPVLWRR